MNFNISNHPTLTGITRTTTLTSMSVDLSSKVLVLGIKINHFLEGIHIPELVKDITSTAGNDLQVPTGEPAPESTTGYTTNDLGETIIETIEYPVPTMGEFDYWMLLCTMHYPLDAMLQGGIAKIDASGLLNEKCNYSS